MCNHGAAMVSRKRRLILEVLAVPLLIFLYRFFTVYTVSSGEPLVVMTYNIAGHDTLLEGGHVRQIADAIRRLHPDIVLKRDML